MWIINLKLLQETTFTWCWFLYSPSGERYRSKPQLVRALGDNFDLSCFDFRTGKILQSAIRKSKRHRAGSYDYARGLFYLVIFPPLLSTRWWKWKVHAYIHHWLCHMYVGMYDNSVCVLFDLSLIGKLRFVLRNVAQWHICLHGSVFKTSFGPSCW